MKSYHEAYDLWEVEMEDIPLQSIPANPIIAQIKSHSEEKIKNIQSQNYNSKFTCRFDFFLKSLLVRQQKKLGKGLKKYQGSDRIRQMQILNMKRDFESLRMQEDETIIMYSDKISSIVNKIRLLGEDFKDDRIIENIIVTIP